jgi:carbon starvation protein
MKKILWVLIAIVGAFALGGVALYRGESINALWIVVAALCIYAISYRFYSAWIAAKVLSVDPSRPTPAERLDNGRDFVPTHRWIVFGHHFAAIAGPGNVVDSRRRCARRMRAGHDDAVHLDAPQRPQPRSDGSR